MQRAVKVAPSLMCADFLHLADELTLFDAANVDYFHVDVMDGHYVPNLTLGIDYCRAVASFSSTPLDIHLMVEDPDRYVTDYAAFNGGTVSFHPEAALHPFRTIDMIRTAGSRPGIAIDPATSLESIRYLLPDVALVCVMTVSPGYAGQRLIPQMLTKIAELYELRNEHAFDFEIEVDGNVSWENIPLMIDGGADILVAGSSSLFSAELNRRDSLDRLMSAAGRRPPSAGTPIRQEHAGDTDGPSAGAYGTGQYLSRR